MLTNLKPCKVARPTLLSVLMVSSLFILLFTASMTSSDISAWTLDEDEDDDDYEEFNKRELQIEVDEYQVEIQSKRKNETLEDKIEISFKASDEPEFRVEYRSNSDSDESEISIEIRFQSLIEFIDTNSNNIYDEDIDQELLEYDFDEDFSPITNTSWKNHLDEIIHTFNTTSQDGVFSLQFYIVEEISDVYGESIVPSELKLDIAIKNFPFSESNSKLALYTKLEAENEFELDHETEDEEHNRTTEEREVDMTVGNLTAFFSWKEYAYIDQINRTVYSSDVESDDEDDEKIYLIYEHGEIIIHDPKIGIENITKSVIPFIPDDVIPEILSIFTLPKESYLLPVVILTTIVVPTAWLLSRKNQM